MAQSLTSATKTGSRLEWVRNRGRYFLFPISDDDNGDEEKDMVEFSVVGTVVDTFFDSKAKSHMITVNITRAEMEAIKTLVRSSPDFVDHHYRWPFVGTNAKFRSRDDIGTDFQSAWDGRRILDVKDPDQRKRIPASYIKESSKVYVEYSVVPYVGKEGKDGEEGFPPGCTLKLLSVGLLEDDVARFNFETPRKKRRFME